MSVFRGIAIAMLATVHVSHVFAQEPVYTPTTMGRDAAFEAPVMTYFLAGVVGGSGVGITAAHYIRGDRSETPYWPAVAGATIILGTGVTIEFMGPKPPEPHPGAIGNTEYNYALRKGMQSRRRNALALGSTVGIATGVAIHTVLYGIGR